MSKVKDIEKYGYYIKQPKNNSVNVDELDIPIIQKKIIVNRLLPNKDYSVDELTYMYYNTYKLTNNISKLKDIDKASSLLIKHIENNKHICVVVDYDSDGVNSGVVLYRSLFNIFGVNKNNLTVIVNRRRDGNGFNHTLVNRILEVNSNHKIDLLLSADHGSANEEVFKILKTYNIELLITDHHLIPENSYPTSADVFINPMRVDSEYNKDVSGCFVAFILLVNTYTKMYNNDLRIFNNIIPYVAISTVTDVMSLQLPINRYIVKLGINEINSFRNKAWIAIKHILGVPGKFNTKDLGFKLGPLINTANRVGREDLAFELLKTDDFNTVEKIASELSKLSILRKSVTKTAMVDVNKQLANNNSCSSAVTTINTDYAINGIVAANVGSSRNLPSVCFLDSTDSRNILVGSCRGIVDGIDVMGIFNNINNTDETILIKYGGHKGAAGCSIHADKLDLFKILFNKYAKEQFTNIDIKKDRHVDLFVQDYHINPSLAKSIDACSPYGKDWEEPVLLTKVAVEYVTVMGTIAKILFRRRNNTTFTATHFFSSPSSVNINNIKTILKPKSKVYLAFTIGIDCYLDTQDMLVSVVDISVIKDDNE